MVSDEALTAASVPEIEPLPTRRGRYGRQNLILLAVQALAWFLLLSWIDSTVVPWWSRIIAVLLFCGVMQGVFTMMHEYFHNNAHRSHQWNTVIGVVGATLFGTSATLHRIHHWGHHIRNRTAAERGEFIHPGEHPIKKIFTYYFAILGGLWLAGLLFPLFALFIPYRSVEWLSKTRKFNTYSAAYQQFKPKDWTAMRLQALGFVGFWSLTLWITGWSWTTLLIAYGAFAFSWSSLQWVYHLRTPMDVVEGAYNLRLPTPIRWLFLNFNYNLTHHRHPHMPWQELFAASNPQETQPLWYRWLAMFRPPVPLPEDLSFLEKRYF